MTFPAAGTFNVPVTPADFTAEDGAAALESLLAATKQLPGASARTELTISSGIIIPTAATHSVDTEADAATDDLSNIQYTNLPEGAVLILWPENANRVVTLKHMAGSVGQISMVGQEDLALSGPVALQRIGSVWYELFHGGGGMTAVQSQVTALAAWVVCGFGATTKTSTGALAFGTSGHDGLLVTETSPVSMKVQVAAGLYAIAGVPYALSASAESAVMVAPVTNPRIDKICLDSNGAVQITTGSEAASPSVPAAPSGQFPLATIYHRVGETSIKTTSDGSNGYVSSDLRAFFN